MEMPSFSQRDHSVSAVPDSQETPDGSEAQTAARPEGAGMLKFARSDRFQAELRRRVEEYFRKSGRRQRDCPQMYLKTAIIFAWFLASYILLAFVATAWWQAVPLSLSLGLAVAAIGFNIQHDGGHGAYSNHPWINKLMALCVDLVGGSSYIWHWKHNITHHTFVNITGHDSDIDLGFFARLTPHQARLRIHRFQHWYMWPLYGVTATKWQFFDDFWNILTGRIGNYPFPRPRGWNLAAFLGGKAFFFSMAIGIPLLMHAWWVVLIYYTVTSCLLGLVLGVVFQLAHCVEEADFPLPESDSGRIETTWAEHQVQTTVDFSRRSRIAAWLLGGLNFQIVHHIDSDLHHGSAARRCSFGRVRSGD